MGDIVFALRGPARLFGDGQRRADLDPASSSSWATSSSGANILDRLFRSIQIALGNVPGFARHRDASRPAPCSRPRPASSAPCVTLMGLLAFPAMLRAGYDVRLAAGVVCAGGCLGIDPAERSC